MKKRSNAVGMAGVAIGLVGMLLVFLYTSRVNAGAGRSAGTVTAYVATTDIPIGSGWETMAEEVDQESIPKALRPEDSITKPGDVGDATSVRTITKGEVLTRAQFSRSGGIEIPQGQNAVSFDVTASQAVARYIQPGSKANIYATLKSLPGTDPAESAVTKLLLSNISVLSNRPASASTEEEAVKEPASGGEMLITVSVTPEQAEKLIFAKENGSLWLGLVSPGDGPAAGPGRNFKTALI